MRRLLITTGFVLALVLALGGCNQTPVDPQPRSISSSDAASFKAQPPSLPPPPEAQPLPDFPGTVPVVPTLDPQAAGIATNRVEMRLLVITASENDVGLTGWESSLSQIGIPYEVLVGSSEELTDDLLVAANGDGRFQGILLTSNNLSYFDGTNWQSAFSPAEWNLLWQYERDYGVRQVSLYTYPSAWPEDYGIAFAGVQTTNAAGYPATLTSQGWPTFNYLQRNVEVPIRYAYTYLASLDPASTSTNITPILTDSAGNVLGVTSTSGDGRERLALTFSNSQYLVHTELLSYGLLRWVTKGLFLGERSMYFMADVDDWFLPNDVWNPATNSTDPDAYRLTAQDALALEQEQATLRSQYRQARSYTTNLAFNGLGIDATAAESCDPNVQSNDPLTSMSRCLRSKFRWLNHSYSHEYFDFVSYNESRAQIRDNRIAARRIGLRQPNRVLITGDISGLGWYNESGDGPKTDHGLEASNPDFLAAAKSLGVNVVASNASLPSHVPSCAGCGLYHPLEPSILLIPRWPTNVFYMVMTPEQVTSAYNAVYGPNGSAPYWDHDLSYDEFLDVETDIALYHILTYSPYPHFFHAANTHEYAPGRSVLYDYLDRLFERYSEFYRLNLKSPSWASLSNYIVQRTTFMASEVTGVWDRDANSVTVTTPVGGTIYLTGARAGKVSNYGGEPTSNFELPAGGSRTVLVPSLANLSSSSLEAATVDVTNDSLDTADEDGTNE